MREREREGKKDGVSEEREGRRGGGTKREREERKNKTVDKNGVE